MRFAEPVDARRTRSGPLMTPWLLTVAITFYGLVASAQTPSPQSTPPDQSTSSHPVSVQPKFSPATLKSLPRNLFMDQKELVTTPFHLSKSQWKWAVPLGFVGAALVASDTAVEAHAPTDPTTVSRAATASNAGLGILVGAGAGMYFWGHITHNEDERETGFLSGEAAIDALLDTEVLKVAFGRDRPFVRDSKGHFFQGGNSFPSDHAAVSWAIASVIAHEYPGPATQVLAYGLAGGIDAARFAGHKHFMTDLIAGSALGWYVGRQVYRSHSHYSEAEIARELGTFDKGTELEEERDPGDMGSSYVPLDSWVYAAMDRLIGMGYLQSAFLGLRPWTRIDCARLLQQANDEIANDSTENGERAQKIYAALAEEFHDETARLNGAANLGISLDSVYSRFTDISGTPLRDGLHFGQTIVNDFGRPYAEGFNNVTGFTSHAEAGPFVFYARGEYQHAPSFPALSLTARQFIQNADGLPAAPPGIGNPSVDRFDLLEGYVGLKLANWQITFGKQTQWWGADESGPMLFSNNAEPIVMLQINRVTPFRLPSVLGAIGQIRLNYLVGRIDGYHWLYSADTGFTGSWTQSIGDEPFIIGEKVSLKPTDDLELGFSATALSGGTAVPFTLHKLIQASFRGGNGLPGTPDDPGDRRGGFDFSYRIPKLRDWLTWYGDAFTDDQANPWLAWNKASATSGLFLSHFPRVSKLDLRVEGVYTDVPHGTPVTQHGFFYINSRFKSGYTNYGNLIGSWIGRQGQGAEAWTNYWFTPKDKLQLHFRHQKVSQQFLPGGGSLTDFGASTEFWVRKNVGFSASVQYERWLMPVIQPGPERDITASVQVLFRPGKLFSRSATTTPASQP